MPSAVFITHSIITLATITRNPIKSYACMIPILIKHVEVYVERGFLLFI